MPPDEIRTELRDTLIAFYENILKKSGAGGRPAAKHQVRHQDSIRSRPTCGPMPVISDDANANAVKPPADAAAAPPPAPAAEAAAAPPEKPAPPTPFAKRGRGGTKTGARAGRCWLKYDWACISVILCTGALSAWQNRSSESSWKAYSDWTVRISTCQYVPARTI